MKLRQLIGCIALTATACTHTDLPNAEVDAAPNTPVTLTAKLTPTSEAKTRAQSDPDVVPALGETMESSPITPHLFLPALSGYKASDMEQAKALISGTTVAASDFKLIDPNGEPDAPLYMKHLVSVDPIATAGLLLLPTTRTEISDPIDLLYANTTCTMVGKAANYAFEMKHACTKVSVLVVDIASVPITTVTDISITGLPKVDQTSTSIQIEANETAGSEGHCIIQAKYNAADKTFSNNFANPATNPAWGDASAPRHLWNTIMPPYFSNDASLKLIDSEDVEIVDGINIADAKLNITLGANATTAMPARTYSLSLGAITLAGITDANDPRFTSQKFSHTVTGEHIVITIRIDEKELVTGTATVCEWKTATVNGSIGDGDTGDGMLPSLITYNNNNYK